MRHTLEHWNLVMRRRTVLLAAAWAVRAAVLLLLAVAVAMAMAAAAAVVVLARRMVRAWRVVKLSAAPNCSTHPLCTCAIPRQHALRVGGGLAASTLVACT